MGTWEDRALWAEAQVERAHETVREAGIITPHMHIGVDDLVTQRDGNLMRAKEAEAERDAALAKVARVEALIEEWSNDEEVSEWNPLDELHAALSGQA